MGYRKFGFISTPPVLIHSRRMSEARSSSPGPSIFPDTKVRLGEALFSDFLLIVVVQTITYGTFSNDIERSIAESELTVTLVDPYNFKDGIQSEEQLAVLRQRVKGNKGRQLEKYQRRQNKVRYLTPAPMVCF